MNQNIITDIARRDVWRLEGEHGCRCQICHVPHWAAGWRGMAVHHIIHGANGRSDEPCNLLLVCGHCHGAVHDEQEKGVPAITLGNVLWVKSHTDEWDEKRLTELYHRRLPAWDILPSFYMAERCKWGSCGR